MKWEKKIDEIAESIKNNKYEWALVLGNKISYDDMEEANNELLSQIAGLQQEESSQKHIREAVCNAIQKEDNAAIRNNLYGNIWDGVSLLGESAEAQKKRREKYAKKFAVKEHINLDSYKKIEWELLLDIFPGIILTTCQDETIEAFLEEKQCISMESHVYTPYSMTTSWDMEKWPERTLIKLYGTCRQPYHMLLSEGDMDTYYPEEGKTYVINNDKLYRPHTLEILKAIFTTKNLLFIGMDWTDNMAGNNNISRISLVPGIMELLKKQNEKINNDIKRYIITDACNDEEYWKDFNITPLTCTSGNTSDFIRALKEKVDIQENGLNSNDKKEIEYEKEIKSLNADNASTLFWKYYYRRSKRHISSRERYILEKHVLGIGTDENKINYSQNGIIMLAVAANGFADFDDLWKTIEMAEENFKEDEGENNDKIIEAIIKSRINEKSFKLFNLFKFYGDGFPIDFLELFTENEKELKEWKWAAIQLANSGIYVQGRNKSDMYERIAYADSLMQSVGSNSKKQEINRRISGEKKLPDSYFYPVNIEIAFNDTDTGEVKKQYQNMFKKLMDILKDRRDGYGHLRLLLETEFSTLLTKISQVDDPKLEWKPELLYYLFSECRNTPESSYEIVTEIQNKLNIEKNTIENASLKEVMLYQVQGIIMCQSQDEQKQNDAINLCNKAKEILENTENIPSKDIIYQFTKLLLLKSEIYGRMSSSAEIENCHDTNNSQYNLLSSMRESLKTADNFLNKQSKETGETYDLLYAELNHQYGKYYFKESRFHNDSNEVAQKMKNYKDSYEYYHKALTFYKKYSCKYKIQEANVLRDLADLYYHMEESGMPEYKNYKNNCYSYLEEAYMIYRSYNNLHGIADVLQSMGEVEDYGEVQKEKTRSRLCFFHAADRLYDILGDKWNHSVVSAFLKDAKEKQNHK